MAKRLTEKQKQEITLNFRDGKAIKDLSEEYNCTNLTIARNLKKNLGEKIYKELINKKENNNKSKNSEKNEIINNYDNELSLDNANKDLNETKTSNQNQYEANINNFSEFTEISPLDFEIENAPRKEISSVSLKEISFPKVVYMIVDKNIELEIKFLKDFPEWGFLSNKDLNRKTIELFFDLKTAKQYCNKEKKVIKVPNTDVFRIVSPTLVKRGISRIVVDDKLIAL